MPLDPVSYVLAKRALKKLATHTHTRIDMSAMPDIVKNEIVNYGLQIMALKTSTQVQTKDFYAVVADYNNYKGTSRIVGLDNDGGGVWSRYIRIAFDSAATEYAQYKVVIDANNIYVYSVDGTLKGQTGVGDFWDGVKSDGSDIRVANQDLTTPTQRYFWIEKFDYTNKQAVIWVRVEADDAELNIVYGNPSATKSTYENGDMVFEFWDDYEGTSLDRNKWDLVKGTEGSNIFVQNGVLKVTRNTVNIESIQTFSEPVVLELKIKVVSYPGYGFIAGGFRASTTNNTELLIWADGSRIYADGVRYPSGTENFGYVFPTGEWGIIRFFSSGGQTRVTIERAGVIEFDQTVTTTTSSEKIHLTERPDSYDADSGEWYWDWVRVLKLADPISISSIQHILETINFDFPDGIDKVLITVDGDISQIEYSTDDGATWNTINPDEETLLPSTAYQIKFKFTGNLKGYAFLVW